MSTRSTFTIDGSHPHHSKRETRPKEIAHVLADLAGPCRGLVRGAVGRRCCGDGGSGGLSGPAGRGQGARANASISSVLTSASRSSLGCDRPAFRYLVGRVHGARGVVLLHPLQPVPRRPVSRCVPGRKPLLAIIDFLGNYRGRDRRRNGRHWRWSSHAFSATGNESRGSPKLRLTRFWHPHTMPSPRRIRN